MTNIVYRYKQNGVRRTKGLTVDSVPRIGEHVKVPVDLGHEIYQIIMITHSIHGDIVALDLELVGSPS